MTTPIKSKVEAKWNDQSHAALLGILVDIVTSGGTVSIVPHKEKIMSSMEAQGFQFTWEGIR
jgi:hypothetical protein